MIVVTGTKRSGTSMWMQILVTAGFNYVGEKFPGGWATRFKEANPEGFYEHPELRRGVPDHLPVLADDHAIKLFIPGVRRTKAFHLSRVIATVRSHDEFEASRRRFWELESAAYEKAVACGVKAPHLPYRYDPLLEWWIQNVTLLNDSVTRSYPIKWVAYDAALENPRETLTEVLDWLGHGNREAAFKAVKPGVRTQKLVPTLMGGPRHAELPLELFQEFYTRVRAQIPFDLEFVRRANDAVQSLATLVQTDIENGRRHNL